MAEADVVFRDDFSSGLAEGWSWVHEDRDNWEVSEGRLRIRTQPGSLWGDRNDAHNVLVRPAPRSLALATEALVTKLPTENGEQAGLIWYQDDGNYIKLVKEMVNDLLVIVMAREEGEDPGVVGTVSFEPAAAELRLALETGRVTGHCREVGQTDWQAVGECDPMPSVGLKVGLFTHGGTEGEDWAQFEAYRVLR
jgi:regulation of enolase protein 1 (concanavalin A-like superfamily)